MVLLALGCAAVLIATAALAVVIADAARARLIVYGVCLGAVLDRAPCTAGHLPCSLGRHPSVRTPVAGRPFPSRCAFGLFPCRGHPRRGRGQSVRARIRPP